MSASAGSSKAPVRVSVNGQTIPQAQLERGELLKLGPGLSSLDFDFTAINFIAPEKTQLRYRMENSDNDWVQSDVARCMAAAGDPAAEHVTSSQLFQAIEHALHELARTKTEAELQPAVTEYFQNWSTPCLPIKTAA